MNLALPTQVGAIDPNCPGGSMNRPYLIILLGIMVSFAGCQSASTHKFAEPTAAWQSRTGQLLFAGPKTQIAGELLVRHSTAGDFELTFSKGPGVNLLVLRQDARFAQAEGPLARGRWSGEITQAPEQLKGWLSLRDAITAAGAQRSVRKVAGAETFLILF